MYRSWAFYLVGQAKEDFENNKIFEGEEKYKISAKIFEEKMMYLEAAKCSFSIKDFLKAKTLFLKRDKFFEAGECLLSMIKQNQNTKTKKKDLCEEAIKYFEKSGKYEKIFECCDISEYFKLALNLLFQYNSENRINNFNAIFSNYFKKYLDQLEESVLIIAENIGFDLQRKNEIFNSDSWKDLILILTDKNFAKHFETLRIEKVLLENIRKSVKNAIEIEWLSIKSFNYFLLMGILENSKNFELAGLISYLFGLNKSFLHCFYSQMIKNSQTTINISTPLNKIKDDFEIKSKIFGKINEFYKIDEYLPTILFIEPRILINLDKSESNQQNTNLTALEIDEILKGFANNSFFAKNETIKLLIKKPMRIQIVNTIVSRIIDKASYKIAKKSFLNPLIGLLREFLETDFKKGQVEFLFKMLMDLYQYDSLLFIYF